MEQRASNQSALTAGAFVVDSEVAVSAVAPVSAAQEASPEGNLASPADRMNPDVASDNGRGQVVHSLRQGLCVAGEDLEDKMNNIFLRLMVVSGVGLESHQISHSIGWDKRALIVVLCSLS